MITNDARTEFDEMRAKLVEGDEKFSGHEAALRAIVDEAKSMFNTLQTSTEQNKHELQQPQTKMASSVNEIERRMEMMGTIGGLGSWRAVKAKLESESVSESPYQKSKNMLALGSPPSDLN